MSQLLEMLEVVKRQLSMNWFKILLVEDLLPNPNTLLSLRPQPDPDQGLLEMTLNDPMFDANG